MKSWRQLGKSHVIIKDDVAMDLFGYLVGVVATGYRGNRTAEFVDPVFSFRCWQGRWQVDADLLQREDNRLLLLISRIVQRPGKPVRR
uniref:hypothetical protein n=1 Tax=Sphingomonas sp. GlSt437 TaxID=3389970 RepID=UPI003A8C1278